MQFFILVILICLFIFLYCVYVLSNDDFIFLRRDISMDQIFNIIFIGGAIGLFVSRLFYGIAHEEILNNPLMFLAIPYFPGLSLLGGVVGAGGYFLFLKTRKENFLPLGRICDFFSVAFLMSASLGFMGYLLFSEQNMQIIKIAIQAIVYLIFFIVFLKFLLPRLLNGKFKEGTITFIFLICFSIISLVSNVFPKFNALDYFKNFENIILLLIFISSVGMLTWQENLLSKIKQSKKVK